MKNDKTHIILIILLEFMSSIFMVPNAFAEGIKDDSDYKNFIKYYQQAIIFNDNKELKKAQKRTKYALGFAKKLNAKGLGDQVKEQVKILSQLAKVDIGKPMSAQKSTTAPRASSKKNRDAMIRGKAHAHEAQNAQLEEKKREQAKQLAAIKAKREAVKKRKQAMVKSISQLPPSMMSDSDLEAEFKALASKRIGAAFTIVKIIFRKADWGINKNSHDEVISRGLMTAFAMKKNDGTCHLQYVHFEQKYHDKTFGKSHISRWSDKTPKLLSCDALE